MPELDQKATSVFAGKVVRKDLVRKVKVGANVPVFVLEYLLGKYCATDDPAAIDAGLRVVNTTLTENFVRPDEANAVQSKVKDKGKYTLIDKVKVRYLSDDDKHWAELVNFGHKNVHVPEHYLREYDRLLMGGVWAQVEIRHQYDEEQKGKRSPFWIDSLKPIQLANFDFNEYRDCRIKFNTEEWIDLLLRTIGMEPSHFDRRLKLLFLTRLIPLCEANYNLVELGPRGTGKSYAYQELSPYCILMTGPTTVANLFYNMASGKMGLVGIWDAVAFDEVADLQKMPKEVVTTLKTYCESGSFARGKESLSGMASIAMFGNTNQPVEVMVKSSHLFMPMPDVIREDMAFIDRLHFYLPGWEVPKMRVEFFTDHYGFVVDYLAEALGEAQQALGDSSTADGLYRMAIQIGGPEHIIDIAKERRTKIAENRMRENSNVRLDVVEYIKTALAHFREMQPKQIQDLGIEIGLLGTKGLSINDPTKTYKIKSLEGEFTGLQLVVIMYAAFQQFAPEQEVGVDFSQEYEVAKMQR